MTSLPIAIPDGFTLDISEGMEVSVGQILAHKTAAVEQSINIAEELQIPLKKVKNVLTKNPGENVSKGDIIAVKKNLFGKRIASISSSVDGIVARYERDTGNFVIRTHDQASINEIISPVDGKVDLCNNKEIVIHTDKALVGGRANSGTFSEGEIYILEESFQAKGSSSILFFLDSNASGKIVLGGSFTREVLVKGIGIGAAGFIGIKILDQDLIYLQEKKITLPVLEIEMDAMTKLKQWEGKKVRVDAQNKTIVFLQ